MNKLIISDLDNTLIPCSYTLYILNFLEYTINKRDDPNKKQCLNQIRVLKAKIKKQGHYVQRIEDLLKGINAEPILKEIVDKQTEIDINLINEYNKKGKGFCLERFPDSFVLTLERFYKNASTSDKAEVIEIAKEFMNIKAGLYDGVEETLDFLVKQKDELVLLTKGDPKLQNKKIKINNLDRWFKEIYIRLDEKAPKIFEKLGRGYKKEEVYSIGDSINSDINPALKVGYKAIHIPQNTWAFEIGEKIICPERTLIFKSFKDIKENYSRL